MQRRKKIVELSEAAAHVKDGMRLAVGGFAIFEQPMAFLRELIRRDVRDLTLVGVTNGLDFDLLVGAGVAARVETSYVGLEKFGIAQNFRRKVEAGQVEVVDYPEMLSWDRFRASQDNLTFIPVGFLGGTDIVRLNPSIKAFSCPLTGRTLHAVPPAAPDVVVIHATAADEYGNVLVPSRRMLPQSINVTLARSCDTVIVTAERIVSNAYVRRHAHLNQIPSFKTTCVVHLPWGAHPSSSLGAYEVDDDHINRYVERSRNAEGLVQYLDEFVHGCVTHDEYLRHVGVDTLARSAIMGAMQ